jgi:hypothetical protein
MVKMNCHFDRRRHPRAGGTNKNAMSFRPERSAVEKPASLPQPSIQRNLQPFLMLSVKKPMQMTRKLHLTFNTSFTKLEQA